MSETELHEVRLQAPAAWVSISLARLEELEQAAAREREAILSMLGGWLVADARLPPEVEGYWNNGLRRIMDAIRKRGDEA